MMDQHLPPLGTSSRAGDTRWGLPSVSTVWIPELICSPHDPGNKWKHRNGLWIASIWHRLDLNHRSLRPGFMSVRSTGTTKVLNDVDTRGPDARAGLPEEERSELKLMGLLGLTEVMRGGRVLCGQKSPKMAV